MKRNLIHHLRSIISLALLGLAPVARADLNTGLVAYYPFNGNPNDASGNGNNGTAVGATFATDAPNNRTVLLCNGTSSTYVVVPRSTSLEPTDAISISLWCKGAPGQSYGTILRKADGCQAGYIIRAQDHSGTNHTLEARLDPLNPCSGGTAIAAFSPSTGTSWQHLVATYSRTDGLMRTYVNGVEIDSTTFSQQLQHSGDLFIGGATVHPQDGGFNGLIDDVRIYNRALSAAEIQELAGSCSGDADTDGDGLKDCWEIQGIDVDGDGLIDLDLPALGADPFHKDLFVEVDAMVGRAPSLGTLNRVIAAFGAAPVDNPDGVDGIALHLELDETNIPLADWPNAFADFDLVKNQRYGTALQRSDPNWVNIRAAKTNVYRYCVFANTYSGGDSSGLGERPGNDFMVTLGAWGVPGGTGDQQAGTFMHELGHNLDLDHGGGDPINFKPNYHSVMNYHWQTPHSNHIGWLLDYSRVALPILDESHLNENAGIGGSSAATVWVGPLPIVRVNESGSVDWNRDRDSIDSDVSTDINRVRIEDPSSPGQVLRGHNDWAALWYRLGGHRNFQDGERDETTLPKEITYELQMEIYEDNDDDGLVDGQDSCPGTPPGSIVNAQGCSIDQLVPCAGPRSGGKWKTHGDYVSAVANAANQFLAAGLITQAQKDAIVAKAAASTCGGKK